MSVERSQLQLSETRLAHCEVNKDIEQRVTFCSDEADKAGGVVTLLSKKEVRTESLSLSPSILLAHPTAYPPSFANKMALLQSALDIAPFVVGAATVADPSLPGPWRQMPYLL